MKKTPIHIFYSGDELSGIPAANEWEKFEGQDTVRLFLFAAEQWRLNGWEPFRLSTSADEPLQFSPLRFSPGGRIDAHGGWYPWGRWQFLAAIREITKQRPNDWHFFSTLDVFNILFSPDDAFALIPGFSACVSFQRDHFSMSCIACRHAWVESAIDILHRYDIGELPFIGGNYVSDETIIRTYAKYDLAPVQAFPLGDYRESNPRLLHYARSTISRAFEAIPLSR